MHKGMTQTHTYSNTSPSARREFVPYCLGSLSPANCCMLLPEWLCPCGARTSTNDSLRAAHLAAGISACYCIDMSLSCHAVKQQYINP